ncbi:MAG TPA: ATP-binding protein [Candidatus Scybalocola faecigallinarum]|uniref:ATP-binding protein n=1 Tax=Candidatus Scybalocola faecigallinarum TaxID=2840941 RepID=A0A9D1F4D4_9FIRM|nr:ATP-binding protein [Candidatus Scybalocola faecigallinarum]
MKEIVEETLKKLATPAENAEEDYIGEDGLLYCGKCHMPKEAYFSQELAQRFGMKTHPKECDCQRKVREQAEVLREQSRHTEAVRSLKEQCFSERAMQEWNFQRDHEDSKNTETARFYVKHWEKMKRDNIGLLFWGAVGTGKSFLAGCIANALLEQEIPVRMTNFEEVLNDLSSNFSEKNEYIKSLCRFPLLILDDFGMERGTEYGLEQIYAVIDGRYRSGKPLIVTTNLTLNELNNPRDTAHARIYDRLKEMCVPLNFSGESRRRMTAQEKLNWLKEQMKGEVM